MPFDDELSRGLSVLDSDPRWPQEFELLKSRLRAALGDHARAIDHTVSTSVPGLPAKDCIDVQVVVDDVNEIVLVPLFESIGFRFRREPWNVLEQVGDKQESKLVFAPPVGEHASNVHVRLLGSDGARRNLLFRDFLCADAVARSAWGRFKQRLAQTVTDIYEYGQIKDGPTQILFIAAEDWARRTNWKPRPSL